jgi:enterochelin esterase family protein
MEVHAGVLRGEVKTDSLTGVSGESHPLQIYVPARKPESGGPMRLVKLDDAGQMPLVITIGGQFAENNPIPTIMDNLIAAGKIPPTMVVSIGFANMAEYVAASRSNERFARYVARELLPWLRDRYPITTDARRIVISGASAPGAGSIFVAMRYAEAFGNVISMGGGYAYPISPAGDELIPSDHPVAEPIARELASRPTLPFRVFLAVGTLDDVPSETKDPRYAFTTVLVAARHLRDVLEARGYDLTYREFGGAHETLVWRRSFADGITTLLGSRAP